MKETDSPVAPFEITELQKLIGVEVHTGDIARATVRVVERLRADHVSVLHVACSDGLEQTGGEHFRDLVARHVVNMGDREWAPLRTANLGARYERGSGAVAASHFSGSGSALQLISIAAHVGVMRDGGTVSFGFYDRGGRKSRTCGALGMLMAGQRLPFLADLREEFNGNGLDRLALLERPDVCASEHKALFAAAIQARLQARRALLDSDAERLLICATVTMNQRGPDHEILVGFYSGARDATGNMIAVWCGLGDDPSKYTITFDLGSLRLSQPGPMLRSVRNKTQHRTAPLAHFVERQAAPLAAEPDAEPCPPTLSAQGLDALSQLDDLLNDPEHPWTSLAVKGSCLALGEVLAVPAVLALFAGGAMHVHHAVRMRRLASEDDVADHEHEMLLEIAADDLAARPIDQARQVLQSAHDKLASYYGV